MKDALFLDNMITPKIITFIYWLLLLAVLVGGVTSMFATYGGFTFGRFILGILSIIGGALAVRVWCELLIVMFKMNEALQELRHK